MDVIVDRILRRLGRGLEQGADIDIKADVGEGGGDHLGTAIMAVLAHLDDQHPGAAAVFFGESLDIALDRGKAVVALIGGAVNPGEGLDLGAVTSEHLFHGHADFSDGGAGAGGLDRRCQQVAARLRAAGKLGERRVNAGGVAAGADGAEAGDLARAHRDIVDIENFDRVFALEPVFVDPHDHLFAAVDGGLPAGR